MGLCISRQVPSPDAAAAEPPAARAASAKLVFALSGDKKSMRRNAAARVAARSVGDRNLIAQTPGRRIAFSQDQRNVGLGLLLNNGRVAAALYDRERCKAGPALQALIRDIRDGVPCVLYDRLVLSDELELDPQLRFRSYPVLARTLYVDGTDDLNRAADLREVPLETVAVARVELKRLHDTAVATASGLDAQLRRTTIPTAPSIARQWL